MTHLHRRRRGVAPRPSEKCLRLWDRLLKRAEALGDCGDKRAVAFTVAAERAGHDAVAPMGHQNDGSVFFQLVRQGRGFTALSLDRRQSAAPQIAHLAVECRAILSETPRKAPRPDKPAPRLRRPRQAHLPYRKDIDG